MQYDSTMTKNNSLILTALLMVPLFTAGIAVGGTPNVYAQIPLQPISINPETITETLKQGETGIFPTKFTVSPDVELAGEFIYFPLENCFESKFVNNIDIIASPVSIDSLDWEWSIQPNANAVPGEYHCTELWLVPANSEMFPPLIEVPQMFIITVESAEPAVTCGTGTTLNTDTNQCEADVTQDDLDELKAIIESLKDIIAQLESIILGETDAEICHKPGTNAENTKQVSVQASQGHLKHGDTLGVCE